MKKKKNNNQDFSIYTKEIKKKNYVNDDYRMAVSFVVVLVIVLVFIGTLFFLNGKFVSKDILQDDKMTSTTTAPSYDDTVILVNRVLDVSSSKYYVMVYDFEDEIHEALYSSTVSSYKGEDIKLYSVNIGIALNKKYYNKDAEEKLIVTNYKDFNFTRPVLLEINKNKVSKAITDAKEIKSLLKETK